MKPTTVKATLVLFALFALGTVFGVAIALLIVNRRIDTQLADAGHGRSHVITRILNRRLDLTAAQRRDVGAVFAADDPYYVSLQRRIEPDLVTLRHAEYDKVRPLLSASQRTAFDAWIAEVEAARAQTLSRDEPVEKNP